MPKSRASFVKRQREMAKKEQRKAKLRRKLERKAGAGAPIADAEEPGNLEPGAEPELDAPRGPAPGLGQP